MPIQRRQPALFSVDSDVDLLDVEDRKTDELVVGFVGPIHEEKVTVLGRLKVFVVVSVLTSNLLPWR